MFSFLATLLGLAGSVWSWFKTNKDQRIGQLQQQNDDLKQATEDANDYSKVEQKVDGESRDELVADLDKRVSGFGATDSK